MKLRFHVLTAACGLLLAAPTFTYSQTRVAIGVGVHTGGPHVRVGVGYRAVPYRRVFLGGYYYAPLYYGYPWYWYNSAFWYGAPYWYPYNGYAPYAYPGYAGGSGLRLQVTPRNAEVFIDGYYAGVIDNFDGFFQQLDLPPGEHDLELYLPGYRSVQQRIYLQPGKTFRVRYMMEPLRPGDPQPVRPSAAEPPPPPGPPVDALGRPAPNPRQGPPPAPRERRDNGNTPAGGYGTLAVRVQPADAEVVIDGETWTGAQAGERLDVQLAAGTHNVEVRKNGYRIYSTDVTIQSGQTATLNVALTRQ